jgi:hypothetical protein
METKGAKREAQFCVLTNERGASYSVVPKKRKMRLRICLGQTERLDKIYCKSPLKIRRNVSRETYYGIVSRETLMRILCGNVLQ